MNTCKDCVFFKRDPAWPTGYPYKRWGSCAKILDETDNGRTWEREAPDGVLAISWDGEGYSAGLYVSEDFGCIQFEPESGPGESSGAHD